MSSRVPASVVRTAAAKMARSTDEPHYAISALAKEFGITPRAIRFYESRGLLSPERVGTTRRYSKRDRARLMLILRGKRLGFSLAEIREYLQLYTVDPNHLEQLRLLLHKVRDRLSDLEQQRRDLETTIAELREIEQQATAALHVRESEPNR